MNARILKEELVSTLAKYDVVKGIGQTGDMNVQLISGKSDIDLFVLCSTIPSKEERQALYATLRSSCFTLQMGVCPGGLWGYGDILLNKIIELVANEEIKIL